MTQDVLLFRSNVKCTIIWNKQRRKFNSGLVTRVTLPLILYKCISLLYTCPDVTMYGFLLKCELRVVYVALLRLYSFEVPKYLNPYTLQNVATRIQRTCKALNL